MNFDGTPGGAIVAAPKVSKRTYYIAINKNEITSVTDRKKSHDNHVQKAADNGIYLSTRKEYAASRNDAVAQAKAKMNKPLQLTEAVRSKGVLD